MRLFEDDAEFFSDAQTPTSLPVSHDVNNDKTLTQSSTDEHNGGESLMRGEATGKGLSSIVGESPALASVSLGPSFLIKLLILLIPMLAFVGFYTYSQVKGATFIGKTLDEGENLERGLVGHWTFDGGDMTTATATDMSGTGNDAVVQGEITRVIGKNGQAIKTDGVTQYLNAGSASSVDNMAQITVVMWVKPVAANITTWFLSKNSAGTGWQFSNAVGGIGFSINFSGVTGSWTTQNNSLSTNNWYQIAISYDSTSTSNDPIFYINGQRITNVSEISTPSGAVVTDAASNMSICQNMTFGQTSNVYICDDVRVYNRILTAKEVERLYKLGEGSKVNVTATTTGATGLVGHWTFDGPDLTTATATDKSGRGNHGALANGPRPTIGKLGQGLLFTLDPVPSTAQYIQAGSATVLDDINELTVTAWIKPGTSPASDYIVTKGLGIAGWAFRYTDAIRFVRQFSGPDGDWQTDYQTIVPGEWTFVAVTYNKSSASNLPVFYINGVSTTPVVFGTPSGSASTDASYNLYIGNRNDGQGPFDGVIDDVRIYNRILTADEIADLYTGTTGSVAGICGTGGVRDADGNTYGIVQIGTQCWLDRNMNVGTRVNAATTQTNNGTTEKYCYDDTASNCTDNHPKRPDGGLYQWNEAMQYSTTEGAQGICPSGWHIPTHDEFTSLERTVCTSSSCATDFPYDTTTTGARGTDEGTKLKPNGTSLWEGNLTGNSFGPGFSDRSFEGYYWSSSQNGTSGRVRQLSSGSLQVIRGSVLKTIGFSVRCIKD